MVFGLDRGQWQGRSIGACTRWVQAARFGAVLALWLVALSPVASADPVLVMPFGCSVQSGRVVISAAADTAYPVLGQHERRPYGACRGAAAASAGQMSDGVCRTWMIHKFDLPCAGGRASWAAVAAAIGQSKRPDRVWVERGQLHLAVTPHRAGQPYLASPGDEAASCEGAVARVAAGRAGLGRPGLPHPCAPLAVRTDGIALPLGFAPVRPFGARLMAAAAYTPPPAPQKSAQPSAPAAIADKSVAKPQPDKVAAPHNLKPAAPAPAVTEAASPAGWTPVVTRSRRDLLESNPYGLLVWIATAMLALGGAAAWRLGYGARILRPATPLLGRVLGPALASVFARLQRKPTGAGAVEADAATADSLAAAVTAGHLHITAMTEQIEEARQDLLRLDDAALRAVLGEELYRICQSLDAIAKEPPQTAAGWSQVHHMLHGQSADIRRIRRIAGSVQPPAVPDAPSAAHPGMLPDSKHTAYAVLGLNSDASEIAAKKVVDGLRQTWHPDTARDEPDRVIREARMKQINAAWDLIRTRAA